MTTISITAVSASREVASAIAGYAAEVVLTYPAIPGAECRVRPDREYTELRFEGAHAITGAPVRSATVSILRPVSYPWDEGHVQPATVTHSSSSTTRGREDARATAALLGFAATVARILDDWAAAGQLPYLAAGSRS